MTRMRAALFASMLVTSMALPADAAQKAAPVRGKVAATKKDGGIKKVSKLAATKKNQPKDTKKQAGKSKIATAAKAKKIVVTPAETVEAPAAEKKVIEETFEQPAEAQASVAAPKQKLGIRILKGIGNGVVAGGKAVGRFVGRQFQMRDEMKESLTFAKYMRKSGELALAAEVLRDAPRPEGVWERFRVWRGKKAVLRLARRELKAKRLDSDPAEGFAAFSTLKDAKMTSWIDRLRASRALNKGVVNAVRTAQRLGNKGRYEEAFEKIDWSIGERESVDQRTVEVVGRLYSQAMKTSERSAIRFQKAHSDLDKDTHFTTSIRALNMANAFAEIIHAATEQKIFDEDRAGKVAQRMGLDQDGLNRAVTEIAHRQTAMMGGVQPEFASAEPAAEPAAEQPAADKLDTTKGDNK